MFKRFGAVVFFMGLVGFVNAQRPAFPGAEGFGALASVGPGEIYYVTSLNDSGPGTFRDAVSQPNRYVLFKVSGIISISKGIKASSNLYIAGQTAPGEGITVFGNSVSFSGQSNVIVRYIRFRGSINMGKGACTLVADDARNIIFDHVSVSWGRWDNLHIKNSSNITLQYCIFSEGIDPQQFGALLERPDSLTIHHCLWMSNTSRNPKAKANIQFVNNIIYNWGKNALVGGHSSGDFYQEVVNNYFIAGPSSSNSFLSLFEATDHVFQKGNFADVNRDGVLNGLPVQDSSFLNKGAVLTNNPYISPKIKVNYEEAKVAYYAVLESAGASLVRDKTDVRLINELNSLGKLGALIGSEKVLTSWEYPGTTASIIDTDKDGMPDSWENEKKLNPNDPLDRNNDIDNNGYTNLEDYLNDLTNKDIKTKNQK